MKIKHLSLLVISGIICSCTTPPNGSLQSPIPDNSAVVSPQPSDNTSSGNDLMTYGTISGSIKSINTNTNISNANLELYKNDRLISSVKTNADGSYNFSNIPIGSGYSVKVKSDGYNDFWYYDVKVASSVNSALNQINLSSISSGQNTIAGTLKDYNLASLQGALIKAFNSAGLLIATGLVNSNGSYNLNLPLGSNNYLEVIKANYKKLTYKDINVTSGSAINLPNMLLVPDNASSATVQGNFTFPGLSLDSERLAVKLYKNINGLKYFIQEFLLGLNGAYNFQIPIGSDYSFDVNYNNQVYASNKFVVNTGTNNLNDLNLTLGNPIATNPIITQPSPSVSASPVISVPTIENNKLFQDSGSIVFNKNNQIYLMTKNTAKPIALTKDNYNVFPSLSPDNKKVVFLSNRDGIKDSGTGVSLLQMYTMNIDGSNITKIVQDAENYSDPVWSPDGSKIAFACTVKDENTYRGSHYEIFTINADGTNKKQVTSGEKLDRSVEDSINPSWSPDGSKLSFTSNLTGYFAIYTINIDGTGKNKISTKEQNNYQNQSWSPDGSKIAFSGSYNENSNGPQIYVMNADGSNEVQITTAEKVDGFFVNNKYPKWSPDSQKIVFVSNKERILNTTSTGFQIYTMNIDGTNQTRITSTEVENVNPDWAK